MRDMLEQVRRKYGEMAYLKLYTDGSGCVFDANDDQVDEFNSLEDLQILLRQ